MLIRINLAALRAAAARNQKVADTVEETRARMKSLIARLDSAWDGGASRASINSLEELCDNAGKIAEGCQANSLKLSTAADAFEALDSGSPILSVLHDIKPFLALLKGIPSVFIDFILAVTGGLRIEPDEVKAVAAECREVADTYVDAVSEMQAMLGEIMGEWEGRAAQRFADDTQELIGAFIQMSDKLQAYASKLFEAAERYEEVDHMLAH